MSTSGAMSGQFESDSIRLPEMLVAAWSYQQRDYATAAAILLPRMEVLDDKRWLLEIARGLLGNAYREKALIEMVDSRDYNAAIGYTQHLGKPLFSGFEYQDEAKRITQQLTARKETDFRTLMLPTPAEWGALKTKMSRDERIRFLADRLRLVNCRQPGWPADINFYVQQRSVPMGGSIHTLTVDYDRGVEWINPVTELFDMKLEPSDLGTLLPYLAKEDFVLAYQVWRPWTPGWHLFQVNELVADMVNEVAGQKLVDINDYYALSEDERPTFIAAMIAKSRSLHSRPVRAILDVDAVRENWVNPLLGVAYLALGAGWLAWRRKVRPIAWLGAISLGLLGFFAIAQPALQQQRTLLDTAYTPVLIAVIFGMLWLHRCGALARKRSAAIVLVALVAAAAGVLYGPRHTGIDGWSAGITAAALGTVLLTTGRSWKRMIAPITAAVMLVLAFAAPGLILLMNWSYRNYIQWERTEAWNVISCAVTVSMAVGCLAWMQFLWGRRTR